MIILGLGSNIGDKLHYLREAVQCIGQIPRVKVIAASPVYLSDALLPEGAPHHWNKPYLNAALHIDTTLDPETLLKALKQIEMRLGRDKKREHHAPRTIDLDILIWHDLVLETDALTLPHPDLLDRPFALWPLADLSPFWQWQGKTAAEQVERWGSRFDGKAPFATRQIYHRLDTPELVGILNVTPDSFSDGNQFLNVDRAVAQAKRLVEGGATVLDIGAESTSPTAPAINEKTEWSRLSPVLEAILDLRSTFPIMPRISIDTIHPETAEKVIRQGVDWINDQSGLDNPRMRELIKASSVDCVIMHHLLLPERRDHVIPRNEDVVEFVYQWAVKRLIELEEMGIARDRLIFDPGVGFGKMAEQSLAIIKHVSYFAGLGTRVMIGHSRKSFLSLITDAPPNHRDLETAMIASQLIKEPVHYLRAHHTEICSRAFRASATVWKEPNVTIRSASSASSAANREADSIESEKVTA
jgi:2-amino-4-hydroxy-6-hydroxymethyldihydropteridine diphosphokinase/dihydropteroate synthase